MDALRRPLTTWFLAFALLLGAAGCGERWQGEDLESVEEEEEEGNGEDGGGGEDEGGGDEDEGGGGEDDAG